MARIIEFSKPVVSVMRYLLLALLVFSLPVVAADRSAVLRLLNGYEWHLDAAAFRRLGPDAYQSLLAIAADDAEINILRGRALAALALYPNQPVWNYLSRRVTEPGNESRRRRAVSVMCDTFADSRAASVENLVAPLLSAQDVHLRIQAAKCLGQLGGPRARAALLKYKSGIVEPWEARAAGLENGKPR